MFNCHSGLVLGPHSLQTSKQIQLYYHQATMVCEKQQTQIFALLTSTKN